MNTGRRESVRSTGGPEERRLRLIYAKTGRIRFISHRDLIRVFFRTFSRAGLPVAYSRGYSPHPRASFCPPLKVGMEGLGELLDLILDRPAREEETADLLNRHLPEGIRVREARLLDPGGPSLNSLLDQAEYRVILPETIRISAAAVEEFMAASEVRTARRTGDRSDAVNARQGVLELDLEGERGLRMVLSLKEPGRPYPVLAGITGEDISLISGWKWQRLGFLR